MVCSDLQEQDQRPAEVSMGVRQGCKGLETPSLGLTRIWGYDKFLLAFQNLKMSICSKMEQEIITNKYLQYASEGEFTDSQHLQKGK